MKIGEKSDGNPFFAFEIIRGLKEGQLVSKQPDGTWDTSGVIEDIQVPLSVMDLRHARTRSDTWPSPGRSDSARARPPRR